MADEIKNYENIEFPYDSFLSRGNITTPEGSLDSSNGNVEEEIKDGGSFNDIWIKNFIRSNDWSPKKKGFYLDGRTGYSEFSGVFISGNVQALTGTIGGFTIGATSLSVTSGVNTTTLSSGTIAFSAGPTATPTVTISQAGVITATGAIIDGTSTLGGRLGSTLATAIDSAGAFINANLNTSAKTILGSFTFSGSGAIAMNTDTNNGLWLSPTGILGKKAGVNTFTIDTSGNATFAGTLNAAAGTLDTITLTSPTGYIKAGQSGYNNGTGFYLGYSASIPKFSLGTSGGAGLTWDGSTLAITGTITGSTIIGSTLSTATSGQRIVLGNTIMSFYNSSSSVGDIYGTSVSGVNTLGIFSSGINSTVSILGQGTGNVSLGIGSTVYFWADGNNAVNYSAKNLIPASDNSLDLGTSVTRWQDLYLVQYFYYYSSGSVTNIIQPTIHHGYVSGTTISRNNTSGFSATNPSTGNYTLTHNFGSTNYTIQVTVLRASGAGAYIAKVASLGLDSFNIIIFDNAGATQNSDFMFLVLEN